MKPTETRETAEAHESARLSRLATCQISQIRNLRQLVALSHAQAMTHRLSLEKVMHTSSINALDTFHDSSYSHYQDSIRVTIINIYVLQTAVESEVVGQSCWLI